MTHSPTLLPATPPSLLLIAHQVCRVNSTRDMGLQCPIPHVHTHAPNRLRQVLQVSVQVVLTCHCLPSWCSILLLNNSCSLLLSNRLRGSNNFSPEVPQNATEHSMSKRQHKHVIILMVIEHTIKHADPMRPTHSRLRSISIYSFITLQFFVWRQPPQCIILPPTQPVVLVLLRAEAAANGHTGATPAAGAIQRHRLHVALAACFV
mmetsp:Transcript_17206/g.43154  ORF Transcript_17206/g.43154 Transcript_17206/m.43154 type:complete len:206 (-) Transcript_17206:341-958(-)